MVHLSLHVHLLVGALVLACAPAAVAQTVTPGLQGDYWGPNLAAIPATPGVPAGNPNLTRVDATVDFADATYPGAFANADMYVIRWTGFVKGPVTGTVTFFTNTDDGVELVVNNVTPALISNWTDHGATDDQGNFDMVQGLWYPIRLTFYERGGGAVTHLTWSYAGQARAVIPSGAMSATTPPGPAAPTLSIATPQNRTPLISLSWTAVANASSYTLLRSSQSGTETAYQTVAGTTYDDTGVGFGAMYFYVVRAGVGATMTGNSNEVSGSPQPLPPRTTKTSNDHPLCGLGSIGGVPELPALGLLAVVLLQTGRFRRR
ncbi:MAG TPA: PA14 domain-containing protein [Planctomycetota bacterium]|nr:PA14 domain-containing protein [Planctomycetota bacterium]